MTRAPEGDRPDEGGQKPEAHTQVQAEGAVRKPSRYLAGRMVGAARLDGAVHRAIRDDRFATFQAMQVVLLAALSAAMSRSLPGGDPRIALAGAVIAWLGWVLFAHLTATRALGLGGQDRPDWNRLLRTAGMALSPAILLLFSPIPYVGLAFLAVAVIWTAVAMAGAVRYTYDGATWAKAMQASLVGWLSAAIVYAAIILIDAQVRGT